MLRTVAVLMCALLCALWGVKSSLSLKIRRDMLCAVTEGVERLSVGMEHTNRPLATLLYGCGHGRAQPLFSAVADNLLCGMGGADAWTEAIGRMPTGLTEEDIAILTDFSLTLGQSDRRMQRGNTEMALASLRAARAEAENAYATKGRIYSAMGALLGACVAILLW